MKIVPFKCTKCGKEFNHAYGGKCSGCNKLFCFIHLPKIVHSCPQDAQKAEQRQKDK